MGWWAQPGVIPDLEQPDYSIAGQTAWLRRRCAVSAKRPASSPMEAANGLSDHPALS
jgi:hypothetical protein